MSCELHFHAPIHRRWWALTAPCVLAAQHALRLGQARAQAAASSCAIRSACCVPFDIHCNLGTMLPQRILCSQREDRCCRGLSNF